MFDIKTESRGLISHGTTACRGCGLEIIMRNIMDVLGPDTVFIIPPGCSSIFCGYGREVAMKIAGAQGNIENVAAICAGIRAGFDVQGNTSTTVVGFAGDGATLDIGIQALSGAMERRDRILYVCSDNEAYMNTGIQGSSSTPLGASTTTTPGGKPTMRKDLLRICMAHDIPYAATCTVSHLPDLRKKVQKAMSVDGPAVLHIHCPCPTGWGFNPAKSVEIARKAVQSGMWVLYEYENGKATITQKVKELIPVKDYVSLQSRFRFITDEQLEQVQKEATARYEQIAGE